jgi:hypothetical protein
MTSDDLWQLRLLFAWLDGLGHETETTSIAQTADDSKGSVWLRREVIESLRRRVRQLAGGSDAEYLVK